MARFLAGAAACFLLLTGAFLFWQSRAEEAPLLPAAPPARAASGALRLPDPPEATAKSREEKRFSRADHDKNGVIGRDEFLAARRRNFAKLDVNGDGKISFEEYAAKAEERFTKADADKSGGLNPSEFATTRVARKSKPSCSCQPQDNQKGDDGE